MTKLNTDYFIRYDYYGVSFVDETLTLLPQFILDATKISNVIKNQ